MLYDDYARVYDQTGQLHFSVLIATYLPDLLRLHPPAGRRLLDLACGTGTFAVMQAEQGWAVTGLDQSPQMLSVARRKALHSGVSVDWQRGDLADFAVAAPFDLVTCWYDSLNYLLEPSAVLSCFQSIFRALAPGGLVCCDVATQYFLQHYWSGVEIQELGRYVQVMHSSYGADDRSTLVLTGFTETAPGRWTRFREVHVERGYPQSFWAEMFAAAGLVVEGCYDCFTTQAPNERSLRLCWVARRP